MKNKTTKKTFHMWTKEEIKKLVKMWDDKTKEELAEELGLNEVQIGSMARRIRLLGYPLTKKNKSGYLENVINECFDELGIKVKKINKK